MSEKTITVELTSKPIKAALAVTGIAFVICLGGWVYSWGEPTMDSGHWFIAAVVTFGLYRLCRAARWWQHG